ncbi:HipA domain-containing protein [Pseudoclavibacter sp. CFCC 14310]|uniref:HipA domain-containing protein n=1 Tax=Pseudoclavibacter sp. CFCC 14310 TaxID=2615180 RepID=UPI001CE3F23A|nr:HipA domain-containing protein [Pseudoclavibacter sp. CFCC 14310]
MFSTSSHTLCLRRRRQPGDRCAVPAKVLEVWWGGEHVGQFTRSGLGQPVEFHYDSPDLPQISLSLPNGSKAGASAPGRFLRNLLPDRSQMLDRWAMTYQTDNSPFSLLEHVGTDVAGALVILPEGSSPAHDRAPVPFITKGDIAARIISISHDADAWRDPDPQVGQRFSLAGSQGKFTAANIDGRWAWPTVSAPSTHIFKPGNNDLQQVEELEVAGLALAGEAGIPSPHAAVFTAMGQHAFQVERFDRDTSQDVAVRLHTEDMAQALGVDVEHKYGVTAAQALKVLEPFGRPQQFMFIRQLAFNTSYGNSDAHAKNYSIYLEPDRVELTPIYDTVPTQVYPQFNANLAMSIGGASTSQGIEADNWRKLARQSGLDAEEVLDVVEDVSRTVSEQGMDVLKQHGVHGQTLDAMAGIIDRNTRKALSASSAGHGMQRTTVQPRTSDGRYANKPQSPSEVGL